ncbi:branched-chain amino acid transport system II carrier protein [Peptoniphilus equinus]|uniref:Branched-chain amino acid transport system carrier protein n=1 Tax=Peptoniphilus equinus TaxID=3016343 RepID=A0ABY7QT88_9FIRM|nr:branched-chain amino acid transport system II carrier protein [Peptoniphilus equinus]WBW49289.1 branched-chain amino acid transport system II carrier protein [Peptoniphilus equinus]
MKQKNIMLVSAMALFSMLFGAGNLIFPPTLGLTTGADFFKAFIGFVITGAGLVLLGLISTIKAGGTIESVARKLGAPFASLFGALILISIGPGIAIPRTAATTFEVLQGSLLPNLSPVVLSVIFFGITVFLIFRPSGVIDVIGKFLTPALLILLALLIIKGFLTPLGPIAPTEFSGDFSYGFLEGYQTMDMIAALAFTILVLKGYHNQGITDRDEAASLTAKSGIFAAVALGLVYLGLTYIGATTSGLGLQDLSRVQLLIYTAQTLLGSAGAIAISLVMALACLTTSIGLTSTVADFFERLTGGKVKYSVWVILSSLISGYFSIMGVDQIVAIAAPVLSMLYPVAMTLIFLNLFPETFHYASTHIGAVVGALVLAVNEITKLLTGEGVTLIENFIAALPEMLQTFYWIIPAACLGLIFTLIFKDKLHPKEPINHLYTKI